jgi:uncharacterized protein YecE (DUF72 family)
MNTSEIRTGCISWTYPDWLGSFYPPNTKSSEFLSIYSRVFDMVEIDSSFYKAPTLATVTQWKNKTPGNFLFSAKLPRAITHDAKLKGVSNSLSYFEKVIKTLGPKLACVVAQFPPSFKFETGIETLGQFLSEIDREIRYALEFRHNSWFKTETLDLLKKNGISLVWSMNDYDENFSPWLTTDFAYIRFMGKFGEFSKFDHVQKDKTEILEKWWSQMQDSLGPAKQIFALASNHFMGFAPETVNQFRRIIGLEEIKWKEKVATLGNIGSL